MLEVTAQGRHALDTYLAKDRETLHMLAAGLGEEHADDADALLDKLHLFGQGGASYICVNLSTGIV